MPPTTETASNGRKADAYPQLESVAPATFWLTQALQFMRMECSYQVRFNCQVGADLVSAQNAAGYDVLPHMSPGDHRVIV